MLMVFIVNAIQLRCGCVREQVREHATKQKRNFMALSQFGVFMLVTLLTQVNTKYLCLNSESSKH